MSERLKHFRALADAAMAAGGGKILWWLSFCDPHRPPGTQFLGVCIVEGLDPDAFDHRVAVASALGNSHRLGCNPGGEVQGFPLPGALGTVREEWLNRLLSKAECQAFEREHARH